MGGGWGDKSLENRNEKVNVLCDDFTYKMEGEFKDRFKMTKEE